MLTLAVATAAGAGATLEQENKMLKEQVARQADALKMQAEALKIFEANASPAPQPAMKKTLFGVETLPLTVRDVDFDCSQCYSPPPPLPPPPSAPPPSHPRVACEAIDDATRWIRTKDLQHVILLTGGLADANNV